MQRFTATVLGVCALVVAGCRAGAYDRNPAFTAQRAPSPTVAFEAIPCGPISAEAPPAISVLYGERAPGPRSHASSDLEAMLCAHTKQETGGVNVLTGSPERFRVPASMSVVLRNAAAATGAASLFFVVLEQGTTCENERAVVRDESGRPIRSIETNIRDCGPSPYLEMKALLFASDGVLLWSHSETADTRARGGVDDAFAKLLASAPAELAAAPVTTTSATDAVAPKP